MSYSLPSTTTVSWTSLSAADLAAEASVSACTLAAWAAEIAKRSLWTRFSGTPASISAWVVASIIASGPQMKTSSMLLTGSSASMMAHLGRVDAAPQQIDFLRLARQHVDHGEAAGKAVLQVLQRLVEHHARHAAVAVDQGELGLGLLFQRGGGNRQDRGDTGAGGETYAVDGTRLLDREATLGRHDAEAVAGLDDGGSPVGEQAALDRTDADLELAVLEQPAARAADREVRRTSWPLICARRVRNWPGSKWNSSRMWRECRR